MRQESGRKGGLAGGKCLGEACVIHKRATRTFFPYGGTELILGGGPSYPVPPLYLAFHNSYGLVTGMIADILEQYASRKHREVNGTYVESRVHKGRDWA